MEDPDALKPKYPGCPPGWEPPVAPVMKYSSAQVCVNAFGIESIMPEVAAYIQAGYTAGTVMQEIQAFFNENPPEYDAEDDDIRGRYWTLKGEKGVFSVFLEYGEGYFFCSITVLRDHYFEAKHLLEDLHARLDKGQL